MNIKSNLKYVWLAFAALAAALTISLWLGYDAANLRTAIYALEALMLFASLPCSLFAVLVVWLANEYLGVNPLSVEGIYIATIFLLVVGAMQWFWIARFWSPSEVMFQNLNFTDAEVD